MSHILRRLRNDHANLQRLLVMLERQIGVLDRRERPDWDIVEGVIEYLLSYPDLRHHPLEDLVLRRLQAKDPSAAEPFLGLVAEHREQSEALRRVAAATHQVLQDASMAWQGYIGVLSSFVAAQRNHIRKEEEGFFPAAERILDATDWAELDRQVSGLIDPLFGDQVERRFAALRQNLDSWDITDRWQRQTN
jgi:hemerythrin-like domain-containing protein